MIEVGLGRSGKLCNLKMCALSLYDQYSVDRNAELCFNWGSIVREGRASPQSRSLGEDLVKSAAAALRSLPTRIHAAGFFAVSTRRI